MANLSLKTVNGGTALVDAAALDALKGSLRGKLLDQDTAGYDEARTIWNATIDRRPDLIARCAGAADVVQAVRFARDNGLLLAVRGGGHNIAGNAVCDGGLMIACMTLCDRACARVCAYARTVWCHACNVTTVAFGRAVRTCPSRVLEDL